VKVVRGRRVSVPSVLVSVQTCADNKQLTADAAVVVTHTGCLMLPLPMQLCAL
jgi:hypothetical protein